MILKQKEDIKELLKTKKLLIFDFDGVIADSVSIKTEAFGELYSKYGESKVNAVKLYHEKHGGVSRFEKIKYFNTILLKNIKIEDSEEQFADRFSDIVFRRVVTCNEIDGSGEFIKRYSLLKKILTINSATPTDELKNIIKARGLESHFSYVLGSPESKTRNLIKILEKTGFDAKESIFFGDAFSDIEAAERIGVDFIGLGPFFQGYKSKILRASILNFNNLID